VPYFVVKFAVLLSLHWALKVIFDSLGWVTSLPIGSPAGWKFSEEQPGTPFLTTKGMKKTWKSLKIEPVNEKLRSHRSHWLRHVTRMGNNRMPKKEKCGILDEMDEDGLEDLWRDLDEAQTGLSRPNSWHDDNHDDDAVLTWALDRGNWSPHRNRLTAGKGTLVPVQ